MRNRYRQTLLLLSVVVLSRVVAALASRGDVDPDYRGCLDKCRATGCAILPSDASQEALAPHCAVGCKPESYADSANAAARLVTEPWTLRSTFWDCESECKYQCMVAKEASRRAEGQQPEKYHGKWPFRRVLGAQEPASVLLSLLNLAVHYHNWALFSRLASTVPKGENGRSLYPFKGLMHVYALLNINAWLWSAVFHTRDTKATEALDYGSAILVFSYSLFLSIVVSCKILVEAARVMALAPLAGFTATHILFLNNVLMDYGWNTKVCLTLGITQLAIWSVWAFLVRHPNRVKLWLTVACMLAASSLEILDFAPIFGVVDAHALWHAVTPPIAYVWWSFIMDDVRWRVRTAKAKSKETNATEGDKKAR